MPDSTTSARETRLRRRAAREGERLMKISTHSPAFTEMGPYCVIDPSTNTFVVWSASLEDLEAQYC